MAGLDIDRSQYADAVEENSKRCQENPQLYRTRQEINSFLNLVRKIYFCAINRQWGCNHTSLTGLAKVNGEHSLIMLVCNIKHTVNILEIPDLIAKLKKWKLLKRPKSCFT